MSVPIRANRDDLIPWSDAAAIHTRWDYDSSEYLLVEMLNDHFFGDCWDLLKGDDSDRKRSRRRHFITITDAEDQIVTVRVDLVDKVARKVFLSRIDRLYAMPVVELKEELPDDPGLTYRYRSLRGGGHAILTSDGSVFGILYETRTDAEREIANCYETKIFVPSAGHEPTPQYVSANAKIYKPRV